MGEFVDVENYLLHGQYPEGTSKGEKANLRWKCRNNYKIEAGILYYRKCVAGVDQPWKICARNEEEKKRILQSCHAGPTGYRYVVCKVTLTAWYCPLQIHSEWCSPDWLSSILSLLVPYYTCTRTNMIFSLQVAILVVTRQLRRFVVDSSGRICTMRFGSLSSGAPNANRWMLGFSSPTPSFTLYLLTPPYTVLSWSFIYLHNSS